jgi:translation initiation factor 1
MTDFKNKLVWSDDPKDKLKIELDRKVVLPSASSEEVDAKKWTAVFRLEKNGRGGKTVTVIDQLPRQEVFVRDLCKELKASCGSGGTYSLLSDRGVIEIQGDKREAIKALFEKKGIRFKGM